MKSVNEEMLESLEIIKDQKLKNELSKIVERFNKNYKTKLDKIFIQKPTAYNLFEKYTDKIYSSNELKQGFNDIIENVLKQYGHDLTVRAENISLEEFINISNALIEQNYNCD